MLHRTHSLNGSRDFTDIVFFGNQSHCPRCIHYCLETCVYRYIHLLYVSFHTSELIFFLDTAITVLSRQAFLQDELVIRTQEWAD